MGKGKVHNRDASLEIIIQNSINMVENNHARKYISMTQGRERIMIIIFFYVECHCWVLEIEGCFIVLIRVLFVSKHIHIGNVMGYYGYHGFLYMYLGGIEAKSSYSVLWDMGNLFWSYGRVG